MEENEETQTCPNCNRDIPTINFLTHSVHCDRNIKICPVCKEPVLVNELEEHNNRLHQLVPCRQCGERARGTDMEDHIRDSCALTIQTCRYCSLDIRRRDMPAHERYCGARTERCAECAEYVQLRYKQLHIDSNHGFVRLNEDSPPRTGMRLLGVATPSRPPMNSRPRFPPYVPITDLIRPNSNREENLRLIAEFRARQRETEYSSRMTDEEIRFKLLESLSVRLPQADEPDPRDDGYNRLDAKQKLIANLRGRTRPREPQFPLGQDAAEPRDEAAVRNHLKQLIQNRIDRQLERRNAEGESSNAPDVVDRNRAFHNVPRRSIFNPNVVVGRNADAPDVVEPPSIARREAARRRIFGPNVIVARNANAPDLVDRNAADRNAMRQNILERNGEVERNVIAPDIVEHNGEAPFPVDRHIFEQRQIDARNVDAPDVIEQNGARRVAGQRNVFGAHDEGNAVEPDVVEQNAMVTNDAEQNDSGSDATPQSEVEADEVEQRELNDLFAPNDLEEDPFGENFEAFNAARQNALEPNVEPQGRYQVVEVPVEDAEPGEGGSRSRISYRVILKRTNDQPQINTAVTPLDKVMKDLGTRSAVKKRPAPAAPAASPAAPVPAPAPAARAPAPAPAPPPDSRRDLPYYSALQRRQDEDRQRREQNAFNLSVGLPPVLDAAAKLEKLRKMDALHHGTDTGSDDYRRRLQGRVWRDNNNVSPGHTLGHTANTASNNANNTHGTSSSGSGVGTEQSEQRRQLGDLQPMTPEQFMARFNELQLIKEPRDIRSSLRELRRGLNEVTAPYNNSASNNNNNNTNKNNNIIENSINQILRDAGLSDPLALDEARALEPGERSPEADVLVPCEFCCRPLRAVDIHDHERACRAGFPVSSSAAPPWDDDIPVIPCEFCTETLPLYLINEHQELCGRESQLLYPD